MGKMYDRGQIKVALEWMTYEIGVLYTIVTYERSNSEEGSTGEGLRHLIMYYVSGEDWDKGISYMPSVTDYIEHCIRRQNRKVVSYEFTETHTKMIQDLHYDRVKPLGWHVDPEVFEYEIREEVDGEKVRSLLDEWRDMLTPKRVDFKTYEYIVPVEPLPERKGLAIKNQIRQVVRSKKERDRFTLGPGCAVVTESRIPIGHVRTYYPQHGDRLPVLRETSDKTQTLKVKCRKKVIRNHGRQKIY